MPQVYFLVPKTHGELLKKFGGVRFEIQTREEVHNNKRNIAVLEQFQTELFSSKVF